MAELERRNRYINGYRTNGAAAYDIHVNDGSAAPELLPHGLPEEQARPVRRIRVRAKLVVSPVAVLGVMAAACMLVLVIFGYVQLYEATAQVGKLNAQISSLNVENQLLRSQYEGKIDLAEIEERATRDLGMVQPTASQNVYLNLAGADKAVIKEQQSTNVLAELIGTLKSSITNLVAYLS